MALVRQKRPEYKLILMTLQNVNMLSKYDLELRLGITMRNVNAYLKLMHEAGEIYIAGYRRDSPHGSPTTMWGYGNLPDAKRPKPKTQAQKAKQYRELNPEAVIREIYRKRAQRYKEKHHEQVDRSVPGTGQAHCKLVKGHNASWCSGSGTEQTGAGDRL